MQCIIISRSRFFSAIFIPMSDQFIMVVKVVVLHFWIFTIVIVFVALLLCFVLLITIFFVLFVPSLRTRAFSHPVCRLSHVVNVNLAPHTQNSDRYRTVTVTEVVRATRDKINLGTTRSSIVARTFSKTWRVNVFLDLFTPIYLYMFLYIFNTKTGVRYHDVCLIHLDRLLLFLLQLCCCFSVHLIIILINLCIRRLGVSLMWLFCFRVRILTTMSIVFIGIFVLRQWPEVADIGSHVMKRLKDMLDPVK